jgi:hypothetical protein
MSSSQRHAIRVTAQRFELDACDLLAGGLRHDREFERGISQSGACNLLRILLDGGVFTLLVVTQPRLFKGQLKRKRQLTPPSHRQQANNGELHRESCASGSLARTDVHKEPANKRHRHLHRAERKDRDPNICGKDLAEAVTSAPSSFSRRMKAAYIQGIELVVDGRRSWIGGRSTCAPQPTATQRELRRIKLSCNCRLNAGCATRSRAAALVKFDALPTARK